MPNQTAHAGDHARIIQAGRDVHYHARSYDLHLRDQTQLLQGMDPSRINNDAESLHPLMRATQMLGRDALLEDFLAWARCKKKRSLRILHGKGGVGKTRFGLELCGRLNETETEWQAGYADGVDALRQAQSMNIASWRWDKPTLVIFDYALSHVQTIKDWLLHLLRNPFDEHPLRILLLERHAELEQGWCHELFDAGTSAPSMKKMLHTGRPSEMPPLADAATQREILEKMLERLQSAVRLPPKGADFDEQLAATEWAGAPLYLLMAALVMHDRGSVGDTLSLGRVDLARYVAGHERSGSKKPADKTPPCGILSRTWPRMSPFARGWRRPRWTRPLQPSETPWDTTCWTGVARAKSS